jgi:hypothetical protein
VENLTQQLAEATEREDLRRSQWAALTLEQKVEALDVKISDEVSRIYNHEFPGIDEQISRAIRNSHEVGNKAREFYDSSVKDVHDTAFYLKRDIQSVLDRTVQDLIAKSSSAVVAEALREALKSTVLITRPASRAELQNKDASVLVVRTASHQELKSN